MPRRITRSNPASGSDTDVETDTETDRTVVQSDVPPTDVPSPNVAMSEAMLHNLVSSIARSQADANRVLIESILASNRDQHSNASSPRTDPLGHTQRSGNFAKCTARFDGKSKDADELEAFIDAIEVFRDCTNISDEHALRGLPMLLVGEAAVWWQGVKSTGCSACRDPVTKYLFRDIFSAEQNSERADVFVCKVRALLSKLPYVVPEIMKLDIVYGLLDRRIRKRVPRDAVDGLEQLITKVRLVEEQLAEVSSFITDNNASPVNPCSAQRRSIAGPSVNPSSAIHSVPTLVNSCSELTPDSRDAILLDNPRDSNSKGISSEKQKRVRSKCSYCKLFGHTVENCRKRASNKIKTDDSSHASDSSSSQLRCYGCGQLGVVRSKCDNCKSTHTSSTSNFCTAHIQVVNRKGVAILDTGATHSIAGSTLYPLLVDAGVKFTQSSRTIGLADGSQQACTTLECVINVTLQGRTIPTTFMVLPNAQTRTLLGRDFITKACILLDLPQSSWCFNDVPHRWVPFVTSFELVPTASNMELMKVEAADVMLRGDEGTRLTTDQRVQLNAFLVGRADQFAKEGPPTDYATHRLNIDPRQEPIASPPDVHEKAQSAQKRCADEGRRPAPDYSAGDLVLLKTQGSNDTTRGQTPKFIPRRDGPYRIREAASSTTYVLERISSGETLGRYHVSQLTPFVGNVTPTPVNEKRRRGRPKRFLD
ncbi:hypothetical protein ABMA27_007118 [Loxostege sticticalis]|uniref:Peptidase A2 domain-containing protein n=1 Tax=Loxostege sticticalis TaxID=481309 RepID=A0ABR3ILM7_LOXSC